nr:NYN domain-containing protein [Lachnospiraceae bacterium]
EYYLENANLTDEMLSDLFKNRRIFPCFFGSALKNDGVDELLNALKRYLPIMTYPDSFSAKVYKIGRDNNGARLTYMKLTGGSIKARELIGEEKVNQIRQYSGDSFTQVDEAFAGEVVAVTGLSNTFAGQGLGDEAASYLPELTPVLSFRIILPPETDPLKLYQQMQEIEEEEPLMQLSYQPEKGGILVQMMGEIQCDILRELVKERFNVEIAFAEEGIVYLETVNSTVEGVGHYEPLRHYAEAHVLIEPAVRGSGISVESAVRDDVLDKNWQRLIMTHIMERRHKGVLTGSTLTDVKITVVGGQAHKKHTEGGDFRQATYRAIRQGLMQAENVLLEPVYSFTMTIPSDKVGRAMTDITERGGELESPEILENVSTLRGHVPVSSFRGYQRELMEYTKGEGQLELRIAGYAPCHNAKEVIESFNYDPEADVYNPTGSIFCEHGAGYYVPWNEVRSHMHVDSGLYFGEVSSQKNASDIKSRSIDLSLTEDELEDIFKRTFSANRRDDKHEKKRSKPLLESAPKIRRSSKLPIFRDRYLLVDGYNVLFEMNNGVVADSIDLQALRNKLQDILCNYQAYKKINLILVFDAYKVKNNQGQYFDYHNIHVVYTKEKQTADAYIEAFTHEHKKTYDITVATSDGLEQMIVLGEGARRMSARELLEDIDKMEKELRELYLDKEL